VRFGFWPNKFNKENPPLELAYALTVHKAQGSDFGKVFVVLPKRSRLMTRELIYTALTRSKHRLVLLVEGSDPSFLYELAQKSETARRCTNLFEPGIREPLVPDPTGKVAANRYAGHLVYRTTRGELVKSKSELLIAECLSTLDIPYQYERTLQAPNRQEKLRPDFSFVDDAGNLLIWEHLGMLDKADYREGWNWKKQWYADNEFVEGRNLFTSTEVDIRDIAAIRKIARKVAAALR
jgi:hypothetical protein